MNSRYSRINVFFFFFHQDRSVIPESLRRKIISAIHFGHVILNKSQERARASVWWPRISQEIDDYIRKCALCNEDLWNPRETLKPAPLPVRTWQKIGTDIFILYGRSYCVIIDYFSRYTEIAHLDPFTSANVIDKLKGIFPSRGFLT